MARGGSSSFNQSLALLRVTCVTALHIWIASCRCWYQFRTVDKDGFPLRFQLLVMACCSLRRPGENQSWQSKGFLLRLWWVRTASRDIRTSLPLYLRKKIKSLIFLIKIASCLILLLLPPKLSQISPGNLRKSRDFCCVSCHLWFTQSKETKPPPPRTHCCKGVTCPRVFPPLLHSGLCFSSSPSSAVRASSARPHSQSSVRCPGLGNISPSPVWGWDGPSHWHHHGTLMLNC